MTEQELREKIAKIIYHTGCTGACCECDYSKVSDADTYCKALLKADALIAAGIGDIREAEHRAQVAERALMTVCTNVVKDEEDDLAIEPRARVLYKAYLKQAEKELAEERKDD